MRWFTFIYRRWFGRCHPRRRTPAPFTYVRPPTYLVWKGLALGGLMPKRGRLYAQRHLIAPVIRGVDFPIHTTEEFL